MDVWEDWGGGPGNIGEDIGLVPWDLDNSDLNQIEDEFSIVLVSAGIEVLFHKARLLVFALTFIGCSPHPRSPKCPPLGPLLARGRVEMGGNVTF